MAGAAEASGSRLRKGSGEILDAVDLAEELDFDDEAPWGQMVGSWIALSREW